MYEPFVNINRRLFTLSVIKTSILILPDAYLHIFFYIFVVAILI